MHVMVTLRPGSSLAQTETKELFVRLNLQRRCFYNRSSQNCFLGDTWTVMNGKLKKAPSSRIAFRNGGPLSSAYNRV